MIDQDLAIAYGGPLDEDMHEPGTLPEALARVAHQNGTKGIIYLQPDSSEIFQPYARLVEEAEIILAGLRALGLHPGDNVMLQVEENHDYLPTFWACVLGGLIVVPISIAPSYSQQGVVTTKLQKAWELSEHPIIIASARLIPELRALFPVSRHGISTDRVGR